MNIEGMSGMGRSTLLVNLFIEHVRQGNGGFFIDPHGDTADQIAKLIPKNRMRDFIWIDPDASLVPPFNSLHFNSPEELELGKGSLFTTFKSLAGSARGDESARVIINAIDAVCEYYEHPTPVHIFRFMVLGRRQVPREGSGRYCKPSAHHIREEVQREALRFGTDVQILAADQQSR
ncbi:MAG TPA: hypothetical protein VI320_02750 [Terracidiphilus sp.]|jgi:hypothetical protein